MSQFFVIIIKKTYSIQFKGRLKLTHYYHYYTSAILTVGGSASQSINEVDLNGLIKSETISLILCLSTQK